MNSAAFENKSLVIITATGFVMNLLCGFIGFALPAVSYEQLLLFQLGDSVAIMSSVIAARYTGLRGQHVAASGFILLGITHGLSLASSGIEGFHIEKGITVIMPMIPTMVLLCWCTLFPAWLRAGAAIPVGLFVWVYYSVLNGGEYYDRPLRMAYLSWMLIEILWSVYIFKDWQRMKSAQ